ncbi:MAG: 2-isopropylmalate synthase [Oscillospiraceae bacterium]|nr:2-isopropylmalate synthase [Oscillospiraceae bacterium]
MDYKKYKLNYFMPPTVTYDWAARDHVEKAPIWCSVDLRDGNQALIEPMSLDEKLEFFSLLTRVGFKEIEVGFPAASDTEYKFIRALIERNLIPEDVTIQVLTQAREHIIRKTFDAIKGAPRAVVHLYNSTSVAQRQQVFKKSKREVLQIAVRGAEMLKTLSRETEGNFAFQYSPESFSGTEVGYALEVCNAVLDVWRPVPENKAIINIPATVELAMPHVFAAQVEYMHKNLAFRDAVTLCLHPHNDRGSAVADAEMGLLAGAQRLEGTLFGNGERTGNLDIVTCAMNMYAQGVDPELDFSRMGEISAAYERLTRMSVDMRHPYAGELVFTAFSGSHQDAIAKGMAWRAEHGGYIWDVPYLPIDPSDVGRKYDSDVIRINSQSGKGGVSFILSKNFGIKLPERMKEAVGYAVKDVSDREHRELTPEWVHQVFVTQFMENKRFFHISECHYRQLDGILAEVSLVGVNEEILITGSGNGRLDAVSNALKKHLGVDYELISYEEHALTSGSSSKAIAYVGISYQERLYWGAGVHEDIMDASVSALTVAVNQIDEIASFMLQRDERLAQIVSYIRANFKTVSLEELGKRFYLSTPYLSKLLKEKAGQTFTDIVKSIRLKKARALLKTTSMTMEGIAEEVGYQNVENFNRLFKQSYGVTPVQFRKEA